jgi:threonine dehydratase
MRALPSLTEIQAVGRLIAGHVPESPLVEWPSSAGQVRLKLENLLPTGSFKIRGATAVLLSLTAEERAAGLVTPSAGNMARAVARLAHEHGIPCTAVVPDHVPAAKVEALATWGAKVVRLPVAEWWTIMESGTTEAFPGTLVHPFADPRVVAGNGTIGLELARDFPDVETVLVPFGGGGLSLGIAASVKALMPAVSVLAVEVSTAAPLSAAWSAGHPVDAPYAATWVDGIGSPRIANDMWDLVHIHLDGVVTVEPEEAAEAVRELALTAKVVAEGAGAAAVAALRTGKAGDGKVACVVSGGNLDASLLASTLSDGGK